MADQPQTADDVLKLVKDNDVRFIRLWFTDVLGQLKSFSINETELEDVGGVLGSVRHLSPCSGCGEQR